jgi:hypothetical protein
MKMTWDHGELREILVENPPELRFVKFFLIFENRENLEKTQAKYLISMMGAHGLEPWTRESGRW